jgi:hypothetical protein
MHVEGLSHLAVDGFPTEKVALDPGTRLQQNQRIESMACGTDAHLHSLRLAVKPLEPADHRDESGRLCGAAGKEIDTVPSQGDQAVIFDPDDAHFLLQVTPVYSPRLTIISTQMPRQTPELWRNGPPLADLIERHHCCAKTQLGPDRAADSPG